MATVQQKENPAGDSFQVVLHVLFHRIEHMKKMLFSAHLFVTSVYVKNTLSVCYLPFELEFL